VRLLRMFLFLSLAFLSPQLLVPASQVEAQQASDMPTPAPHAKQIHLKHVLVVGQTKGFEHDSVSAAMATIYDMGKESGLWDTMIRTDTELLTKKNLKRKPKISLISRPSSLPAPPANWTWTTARSRI
jgi:uncharacterized protein